MDIDECSICIYTYIDAVVLNCGHTFCLTCITDHCKSCVDLICPNCKAFITTVSPNLLIRDLSNITSGDAKYKKLDELKKIINNYNINYTSILTNTNFIDQENTSSQFCDLHLLIPLIIILNILEVLLLGYLYFNHFCKA